MAPDWYGLEWSTRYNYIECDYCIMYIVSDSHTIQDQLFSDNLLRLWRTGAEEELLM